MPDVCAIIIDKLSRVTTVATRNIRNFTNAQVVFIGNDLTRSPKSDCFTSVPKEFQKKIGAEVMQIIKAVSDSDLREVHKIDLEAFAKTDPVPTNFQRFKSELDGLETYVVKDSHNKITGYYQLEPIEDETLYINSIGIPKDLRGTKTSIHTLKAIKDSITSLAEKKGVKKAALHVDAKNEALWLCMILS